MIKKFLRMFASSALVCVVSVSAVPVLAQPAFEQTMAFYTERMHHVVQDQFTEFKHPLKEVNDRAVVLREKVAGKFGKVLHIQFLHQYSSYGPRVFEMSEIIIDLPYLHVVIPAHMDRYREYLASGAANATVRFENALTIGLMHELDHLALDATDPPSMMLSEKEKLIRGEIMAWAETCEHSIRVFVEKGLPVSEDEQYLYDQWVKTGRSVTSPAWTNFIRTTHANAWGQH